MFTSVVHSIDILHCKNKSKKRKQTIKENRQMLSVSVSMSVQSGGIAGMREEVKRMNAWITVSVAHGCGGGVGPQCHHR